MKHSLVRLAQACAVTAMMLGGSALTAGAAHADITRCVGAVGVPGAHACWTSPRFDHIGLERKNVATVPVVCYGVACLGSQLDVFRPGDEVGGRFTAVTYGGFTFTVYRPAPGQQYVVTSSASGLRPAQDLQELLVAVALDAAQQAEAAGL